MLLAGASNLRDVIMFPMNQQAQDLLMGAPSEVSAKQLRELHIRLACPTTSAEATSTAALSATGELASPKTRGRVRPAGGRPWPASSPGSWRDR